MNSRDRAGSPSIFIQQIFKTFCGFLLLLFYVYECFAYIYIYIHQVYPWCQRGEKSVLNPLRLALYIVVSQHVVAEN